MKRGPVLVAIATLAAILALPAWAQTDVVLEMEPLDKSEYPDVSITFTLPAELVGAELPADAFLVFEGVEPMDVSVTALAEKPQQVVLVLDTSGSMAGEPLVAAKEAAATFVDQLPENTELAVIRFGSSPEVLAPFGTARADVLEAVFALETTGETALYDALITASEMFEANDTRRSLVVLSDGGDTVSQQSLDDALLATLGAEVDFFAIELTSPELDPIPMARLAAASGGKVVSAEDPAALDEVFESIARELVHRYTVTYTTDSHGPTDVLVVVEADGLVAGGTQRVQYPSPPVVAPPEPPPVTVPVTEPVVELSESRPPPTRPGEVAVVGLLGSTRALYAGLGLLFAGLTLLLAVGGGVFNRARMAVSEGLAVPTGGSKGGVSGLTASFGKMAERALERRGRSNRLSRDLEKAGVALRVGEFVVLSVGSGALGASLGYLMWALEGAFLGLIVGLLGPRAYITMRASKRQEAFAEQLGDTLQLLGGSLRAGYGLLQAIETVAEEAESPTAEEFRRIKVENQLGRDLVEALRAMAARMESKDFKWVVEAIEIHRDVGGDLGQIIDAVGDTIRDRGRIRRQIRALSAEGRISAIILVALPFVVGTIVSVTNPSYMSELTQSTPGRILIVLGLVFMGIGAAWLRKIVKVVF